MSLLGERRIGKSSLLNQVYEALAPEPGLVSIHATPQNWQETTRKYFFTGLHAAIAGSLGVDPAGTVEDYPGFRDFIGELAAERGTRFLLILDEFELMAGNPEFDAQFFYQLRALADLPQYRFSHLVASRKPLKDLCDEHGIAASKFWNIFDRRRLGLLSPDEAEALATLPFPPTLPPERCPDSARFWRESVRPWAGPHPLSIQIVASGHWNALAGGYAPNLGDIRARLREHLESFWSQCSEVERQCLLDLAQGRRSGVDSEIREELKARGLLGEDGKPFSEYFGKSIPKFARAEEGLAKRLAGVDRKLGQAEAVMGRWEKLCRLLEKLARPAGKVWWALTGKSGEGSGE